MWALAKLPAALEHLPLIAQSIVDVTLATKGRAVKCIALDLDNTLWGGVVGDDGPHGIQIAAHGDGEAFHRFQSFLKELKNRGILLAVCSKNEHENAVRPFEVNSEMVLKLEDITVFVANWDNKADNLRRIRDTLNIGLDSILFLDDNPFERAAVRAMSPEVIVPELPEDPADYVKALVELNLFETTAFSAEDAVRSTLYRQEAQRRLAETTATSFEDYLQSLDMTIEVSRFAPEQLNRITQLLQRSNQFNLTTQRHNQAQCEAMMMDTEALLAPDRDAPGPVRRSRIDLGRHREAGPPRGGGRDLRLADELPRAHPRGRGVPDERRGRAGPRPGPGHRDRVLRADREERHGPGLLRALRLPEDRRACRRTSRMDAASR